jgi:hypothetical protein
MTEVNLRFGLTLKDVDCDIESLASLLPNYGLEKVRAKKYYHWPEDFFSSAIGYCYPYSNVYDLKNLTEEFSLEWNNYTGKLAEFAEIGFEFHITFEVTVNDWNFPGLEFDKAFLDFVSVHNITFGLYFWSGDPEHNPENNTEG